MQECEAGNSELAPAIRRRILIVDDDPMVPIVLRRVFESNYDVVEARDGIEGLRLIAETSPDLVILDASMPGMDGWEVLRRIRDISDLPVIMLTVYQRTDDLVRSLESGADDYITKPFSLRVIEARVLALIRRAQQRQVYQPLGSGAASDQILVGGGRLRIDLARARVEKDGQLVELSRIEYQILALLARRLDTPVPQSEILTEVWGESHRDSVNYVKSYIRLIRRQIEDDPSSPRYLMTRHRLGYVLVSKPTH